MEPYEIHREDYHKITEKNDKIKPIEQTKKEFTKLWHEEEFKAKGITIKDDFFHLKYDAYSLRYMIDHFNFCGLRFDTIKYDDDFHNSFYFDLDKNINHMTKNGMIDKKVVGIYNYKFYGLSPTVSFENVWIYCEQAFDL